MTGFVFVGPTFGVGTGLARQALDAEYRPPAVPGVVRQAAAARPEFLVLIDGAPEPEAVAEVEDEIRFALARGIAVYGAGTLGTFWASRLRPWGMIGLGEDDRAARHGPCTDMPECVVAAGPAGREFVRLSEALRDVRDIARQAVAAQALASEEAERLVHVAATSHYLDRTFPRLLALAEAGGVARSAASKFQAFIEQGPTRLSERDALAALRCVAQHRPASVGSPRPERSLRGEDRLEPAAFGGSRAAGGFDPARAGEITPCGETLGVVRKKALLRTLARREIERANIRLTDADVQATSEQFRREFGFGSGEDLARWLEIQGLSVAGYATAMHDFTVVQRLEEACAAEIDDLVPDQIAVSMARHRPARPGNGSA